MSRDIAKKRLTKHFTPIHVFVFAATAVVTFFYGSERPDYDPLIPAVSLVILLVLWAAWAIVDPGRLLRLRRVDAALYYLSWLGMGFVAPWLLLAGREGSVIAQSVFVLGCVAYLYVDILDVKEDQSRTGKVWSRMLLYILLAGILISTLFPMREDIPSKIIGITTEASSESAASTSERNE